MKNNNNNNRNNNKKTKYTEKELYTKLTNSRIPKSLMGNSPFPPSELINLSYDEPTLVLQGAVSYVVREFRLNSAYDFDPLLGGGTMSGYASAIARYALYHVEHTWIKYTAVSNESSTGTPITFGLIYRDTQPSTTITSYALAQSALGQAPSSGYNMVGTSLGNSVYRSPTYSINPGDIIGKPLTYQAEQGYDGSATTNPVQVIWCAIIVLAPTAVINLTNGLIVSLNVRLRTRFYSLNNTL